MTQPKYCLALLVAEWLFLCISLLVFYISLTPLIIFAVLTAGLAVFLGFATFSMFNGKGFLLSHVCIASSTAVAFVYWLIGIIGIGLVTLIFPLLTSLLPCAAYFLGISLSKRESNTEPFFFKSVVFSSLIVSVFPGLSLSLNLYTFLAAALGLLAYALFYSGRLSKMVSSVFVGIDAGLALIAGILFSIDLDAALLIAILPAIGFLTAGYYLLAYSKAGNKIRSGDSQQTIAPQAQCGTPSRMAQIENLFKLREAGVLTEEEFQEEKNKIFGGK